eukprot:scaffold304992_cov30-Tisochrysis_lutea.AAC.2
MIIDGIDADHTALEVAIVLGPCQPQRLLLRGVQAGEQLVEAVIVALLRRLDDRARLFEQIRDDIGPHQPVALVEMDARKLAEARGVVIHDGLGIPKGLEDRVAFEDLLTEAGKLIRGSPSLLLVSSLARLGRAAHCQILHYDLGGFCLARAGLAGDHDGLRRAVDFH